MSKSCERLRAPNFVRCDCFMIQLGNSYENNKKYKEIESTGNSFE